MSREAEFSHEDESQSQEGRGKTQTDRDGQQHGFVRQAFVTAVFGHGRCHPTQEYQPGILDLADRKWHRAQRRKTQLVDHPGCDREFGQDGHVSRAKARSW